MSRCQPVAGGSVHCKNLGKRLQEAALCQGSCWALGMGKGLTTDCSKERKDKGPESVKTSVAHLRQVLGRQIGRQIHYREMK